MTAPRSPSRSRSSADSPDLAALGFSRVDCECMAWHYVDGLSMSQIGDLLNVSKSAIRDRLRRCQKLLCRAGHQPLVQAPRPKLGRKIHMTGEMFDAVLGGNVAPLIRDAVHPVAA